MLGESAVPSEGVAKTAALYRQGYEAVAEQLLTETAGQNLMPGDRLPTEQGLTQILGATRDVTREAIKMPAAMGGLSVGRGAGILVAASPAALNDDRLAHFRPTRTEHVMTLIGYRRLIDSDTAREATTPAAPLEGRARGESAEASLAAGGRTHGPLLRVATGRPLRASAGRAGGRARRLLRLRRQLDQRLPALLRAAQQ